MKITLFTFLFVSFAQFHKSIFDFQIEVFEDFFQKPARYYDYKPEISKKS